MIWIITTFFSLFTGAVIGAFIMHRKDRNLLHSHKILHNELKSNKIKLNEYQKKISEHFTHNIQLLNKIAEDYQHLYQHMIKSAKFFLPNINYQDNIYPFQLNNTKNEEQLPLEVPRDYPTKNTEILERKRS